MKSLPCGPMTAGSTWARTNSTRSPALSALRCLTLSATSIMPTVIWVGMSFAIEHSLIFGISLPIAPPAPLARRRAPQSLGDHLHHLQCESRHLLDEPEETLFVDRSEPAVNGGNRGGAARLAIDERHLAEYR